MDKINQSLAQLAGQSVYIDANIFIYFLDGQEPFAALVTPFLEAVIDGEILGFTGDAVLAEVMVRPYKLGNISIIERFKAFFAQDDFITILQHDSKAFDLASQISGQKGMKLVDSLHLATALQAGCTYLITHDQKMKSVDGIAIAQLNGLI